MLRQPAALHLHMASAARQYPGSLMGTMAYTRQALLDAARARDAWAAWEKSPRGQKRPALRRRALAPWQQVLAGRLPLVVTCTLENDVRRALALADEFGIKRRARGRAAGVPLGRAAEGAPRAAAGERQLRPAARRPASSAASTRSRSGGGSRTPSAIPPSSPRRACRSRSPRPGRRTSWPASGPRSRRASRARRRCARRRSARPRRWRSRTRPAASRSGKLANVVAWSGEPFAKDTKAALRVRGRPALRAGGGRATRREPAPGRRRAAQRPRPGAATPRRRPTKAEDKPLPPLPVSPPPFPAGKTVAITGGTVLTVGPQGDDRERHAC